jgi:hypothetical protein
VKHRLSGSPVLVDIKVVQVLLQGCAAWWGGVVTLGALLAGNPVVTRDICRGGGGDSAQKGGWMFWS